MSLRYVMRWVEVGVCCAAMLGCASQPMPQEVATTCGGLPPPFKPPFVCPIEKDSRQDGTDRRETQCFDIALEPGEWGGLRVPRQIVCPPFRSR